jgi:hypothetical protein
MGMKYMGIGMALAVMAICFAPIGFSQSYPTTTSPLWVSSPPSSIAGLLPQTFYSRAFSVIRSQPLSITGQQVNITPGSVQTYNIVLTAPYLGSYDSHVGNLTTRYGAVAMVDSNNNVVSESGFTLVNETYTKAFTVTIPTGSYVDYVIVAGITETRQHFTGTTWVIDYNNKVIQQEAYALTSKVVVPGSAAASPISFSSILSQLVAIITSILNAFKALFGL